MSPLPYCRVCRTIELSSSTDPVLVACACTAFESPYIHTSCLNYTRCLSFDSFWKCLVCKESYCIAYKGPVPDSARFHLLQLAFGLRFLLLEILAQQFALLLLSFLLVIALHLLFPISLPGSVVWSVYAMLALSKLLCDGYTSPKSPTHSGCILVRGMTNQFRQQWLMFILECYPVYSNIIHIPLSPLPLPCVPFALPPPPPPSYQDATAPSLTE
jgi:hypothetical protein